MISFWRQLRFLLWKAALIKWRQKFWLGVELIVPLLLFTMLALIRTRDFSDPRPLCHYDSKGMPSSGLLPFFHSMFCSLSNSCNPSPTTGDDGFFINNGTTANESLVVDVLYYGSLQLRQIGEDPVGFNNSIREIANLVHLLANVNASHVEPVKLSRLLNESESELSSLFQELGASKRMGKAMGGAIITPAFVVNALPLLTKSSADKPNALQTFMDCVQNNSISVLLGEDIDCPLNLPMFCDPFQFDQSFVLPPGTRITTADRRSLCNLHPTSSALWKIEALHSKLQPRFLLSQGIPPLSLMNGSVLTLLEMYSSFHSVSEWAKEQPMAQIHNIGNLFKNISNVRDALFCGKNPMDPSEAGFQPTPKGAETPFNKLRDKLVDFLKTVTPGKEKKHDKEECGTVRVQMDINCSQIESAFLSKMRPIFQGYILVSPESPAVERLVERLSQPLRDFDALRRFLFEWPGMAESFQEALYTSDFWPASQNLLAWLRSSRPPIPFPTKIEKLEFFLEHAFGPPSDPNSIGAVTKRLAEELNMYTKCVLTDRFRIVKDEEEMEQTAICLADYQQYFSGIAFQNLSGNASSFDPFVTYKIRHLPSLVDSTSGLMDTRRPFSRDLPFVDLKYLTFGFSFLQEAVDRALMEDLTGTRPSLGMFAQQQPYPCVVQDIFNVANFLGLCIILSFIVPAALLVKNIVLEKEMKLKEQMRIMGLGDAVHFVSWAMASLVVNLVSVIAISLILRYGRVVAHADVTLLLAVLTLFILSSVALSLFVSTMFSNANMATAATTIVYFLFLFPFQLSVKTKSPSFSKFTLIFPQTVICYAAKMIAEADIWQGGAKWSNLQNLVLVEYDVTLIQCMIALACESVAFWILSWYLSAIFPGVYGVSQKWYFPLTRSYWRPTSNGVASCDDTEFDRINVGDMFEADPTEETMTVRIAGLRKIYGNGTKALDGLNMRLYESQITALLGHNGAGKTTTMSMLCGLYSPSSGSASVYGRDLRREMRRVRDVLGVCPQQNVLFPLLTVSEQLRFFAALKGTTPEKLYAAANEILEAVNLIEKADSLAETLSGGQKRRLCIGIALIGGSKFVILDEPTAGVDVNSRKDIWKLLQKNKHGRTILLSTHHMDEADVLSDRIAVLSEGQLVTLGSPVFLKKRFGEAFQLIACKQDRRLDYRKTIGRLVTESPLAGEILLTDMNDDEIIFNIPINSDSKELEKFFVWFEENVDSLLFSDYGISAPTLQQIFIRLAPQREYNVPKVSNGCISRLFSCLRRRNAQVESDQTALIRETSSPNLEVTPNPLNPNGSQENIQESEYDFEPPPPIEGIRRTFAHVKALLACRWHYTMRNYKTTIFEVLLPVLLLLAAEIYAKIALPSSSQLVNIAQMPLPLVTNLLAREPDNYINAWDRNETTFAYKILDSFVSSPGMGTTCAIGAPEAFLKWKEEMKEFSNEDAYKNFVVADCENGTARGDWNWEDPSNATYNAEVSCECSPQLRWNCTLENYPLWEHNYVLLNTTDRIWDFSGWNLSQFTLDATNTYNNSALRPYFMGGFSLGHHSLRAASSAEVAQAQNGWRLMLEELSSAGLIINLNLSAVPASSIDVNDPFSENITLSEIVDSVLANMDVEENTKVWFNNKVWPSLPIYQSALSNALLRLLKPSIDPATLGILTINHPMNETVNEALTTNAVQKLVTFRIILILMVLCTVPAGFTVFLVEDRVSGSFHMQMVSGLAKKTYWLTGYLFDLVIYTLSSLVILLIYLAFGVKDFCFDSQAFFSFFLLFLLYGFCAILWAYCLQRKFEIAALSFILISIGTFFLGAITTLTVIIIEQMMQTDATLVTSHAVCSSLFLLLPQYNLGMAIFRGASSYQLMMVGEQFLSQMNRMDLVNDLPIPSELSWDMMGVHCLALCCHIVLALVVLIIMEHGSFGFLRRAEMKNAAVLMEAERSTEEDDDVETERRRVESMEDGKCPLVVRGLTKAYTKKQLSVKGVSFAVDAGECFGLLGLNGAGKTTTFGMLTGKMYPSGGVVSINGVRVERGSSSAFAQVGYCPQFDALNAQLTTRENLVFFARIRSIPESAIGALADRLLRALHLRPYARTLTSALSGGNKRKLSVAIALISQPSLILLDEPSAGMDPGSQQFLWRVIERLRRSGKAVVMTSHSMEECEALCTRIAIMDRGRVRCLGSKQHLKTKFGEGYSLTIKLCSSEDTTVVLSHLRHELPSLRLEAVHCSSLFFHIDRNGHSIADILKAINKVKSVVALEDFSLSQATLDEVFQSLASRLASSSSISSMPSTGQLTQNTTLSTID